MKTSDIIAFLDNWAPPTLAEDYDNVGLLVGKKDKPVSKILVSLDATEGVVQEAIDLGCELIVSHHPILFKGLKKLNGQNYVARTVEKAIQNQIGLFAIHTNLDAVQSGVNFKMAAKLGLQNLKPLRPASGKLIQLSFFVPVPDKEKVLSAIHLAGAGNIGNYSQCSFSTEGLGRFLPNQNSNPRLGNIGKLEEVQEFKIEIILPKHLKSKVLSALFASHPYEEVAYFITEIENQWQDAGSGMIGFLSKAISKAQLIELVKEKFNLKMLRFTGTEKESFQKIAICGGSGFFLLQDAIAQQADVYITSDIKYHEFFDAEGRLMLMDIGHFESEQFTSELIMEKLSNQFPNIAVLLSKTVTNPVFYA
jgi:dinuclear metal center YbgI/SA1388 family protein